MINMAKKNNFKNILLTLLLIVVLVSVGFIVQQSTLGELTSENRIGTAQLPRHEYRSETGRKRTTIFNSATLGDLTFKILDSKDSERVYTCEDFSPPSNQFEILGTGISKYGCTFVNYTAYVVTRTYTSCNVNLGACSRSEYDDCRVVSKPNTHGTNGYCSSSEWNQCDCKRVQEKDWRNVTVGGGITRTSTRDNKRTYTWEISDNLNGKSLGGQNLVLQHDMEYRENTSIRFDKGTDYVNVYLDDGRYFLSAKQNIGDLNPKYKINHGVSGSSDDNDDPYVSFSFYRYFNDKNLNFSLDIKDSYIEGKEGQLALNVCNYDSTNLKAVLTLQYDFDTFLGLLTKEQTTEINLSNLGCNEYTLEFTTNKTTDKIRVTPSISLYEKGYANIEVDNAIIHNNDFEIGDKIVNVNDYIKVGTVSFNSTNITILPRYSEEFISSLQSSINDLKLQLQDQSLTLEEKAKLIADLEDEALKKQLLEESNLSKSDKEQLEDLITKEESNFNSGIIYILTAILTIVVIIFIIKEFNSKKPKKKTKK